MSAFGGKADISSDVRTSQSQPLPFPDRKASFAHSRLASIPGSGELTPIIGEAVVLVLATWAELPALAMAAAVAAWACVLG